MESLLFSTGIVALAEMGDKTQLLAFILATRFKKPLPIILGIFIATIANHALAGALGSWINQLLSPDILKWVLAISFIAMGIWTLVPDKIEEDENILANKFGVFAATVMTFFLAEMGDKTQIATVALAAHYSSAVFVVIGTTVGMMLANVPAVYLGNRFAEKLPMKLIHGIAALIFIGFGLVTIFSDIWIDY